MEVVLYFILYWLMGGLAGYGARFISQTSVMNEDTIVLILRLLIVYHLGMATTIIIAKCDLQYLAETILVGSVLVLDAIVFAWWFLLTYRGNKDSPRTIAQLLFVKH